MGGGRDGGREGEMFETSHMGEHFQDYRILIVAKVRKYWTIIFFGPHHQNVRFNP